MTPWWEFKTKDGSKIGICGLCGKETTKGHFVKTRSPFATYKLRTNILCPYCAFFFLEKNKLFGSFVITKNEVKSLKRIDFIPALLNPPEPPFCIFISPGGRSSVFLTPLLDPQYSRENFNIALNTIYPVRVKKEVLNEMISIAKELIKERVHTSLWKSPEMISTRNFELLERLKKIKDSPLWEVVILGSYFLREGV